MADRIYTTEELRVIGSRLACDFQTIVQNVVRNAEHTPYSLFKIPIPLFDELYGELPKDFESEEITMFFNQALLQRYYPTYDDLGKVIPISLKLGGFKIKSSFRGIVDQFANRFMKETIQRISLQTHEAHMTVLRATLPPSARQADMIAAIANHYRVSEENAGLIFRHSYLDEIDARFGYDDASQLIQDFVKAAAAADNSEDVLRSMHGTLDRQGYHFKTYRSQEMIAYLKGKMPKDLYETKMVAITKRPNKKTPVRQSREVNLRHMNVQVGDVMAEDINRHGTAATHFGRGIPVPSLAAMPTQPNVPGQKPLTSMEKIRQERLANKQNGPK